MGTMAIRYFTVSFLWVVNWMLGITEPKEQLKTWIVSIYNYPAHNGNSAFREMTDGAENRQVTDKICSYIKRECPFYQMSTPRLLIWD